jgi:GNAT superfamily N-acetyltransferase
MATESGASTAKIRRATAADARVVADVWLRSRHASVPANPAPVHSDDEVRAWFADEVLPTKETWLAEVDGTAVAVLVLDGGWVDQLHVDPPQTGQGLGSRLIEVAKVERPGGLELWAFQANAGARRFYIRHGFVEVAYTDGDNEEGAPDVRLAWSP